MWWLLISWLVGVCICLWAVGRLWGDGGDDVEGAWQKRD